MRDLKKTARNPITFIVAIIAIHIALWMMSIQAGHAAEPAPVQHATYVNSFGQVRTVYSVDLHSSVYLYVDHAAVFVCPRNMAASCAFLGFKPGVSGSVTTLLEQSI